MRLEKVGQTGGDVADLVARCFTVPVVNLVVDERAGGGGKRHRFRKQGGRLFGVLGEAEEPVGRDPERGRAFRDDLGIGKPHCVGRYELRDGRTVDPDRAGQGALAQSCLAHCARQAAAEAGCAISFVGFHHDW